MANEFSLYDRARKLREQKSKQKKKKKKKKEFRTKEKQNAQNEQYLPFAQKETYLTESLHGTQETHEKYMYIIYINS